MIHNDHLDTPQKVTKSDGSVVWSADYKPFGETVSIASVDGFTNNLRFPGQYYDAETGLNYNYYRDYNPVIGRYIEADPVGLFAGVNIYIYGMDNSNRFIDPQGLKSCCPKEEKDQIEKRITEVSNQLNGISTTGKVKEGDKLGWMHCMPWGPTKPRVVQDLPECIKKCVYEHEGKHVAQCKEGWIDYQFKKTEAELEKAAYQVELTCLTSLRGLYGKPCSCEK